MDQTRHPAAPADEGADHSGALDLLQAVVDLAERVARSLAPASERAAVAAEIGRLSARLDPLETAPPPVTTPIGMLLPGRGHPLLPPVIRVSGEAPVIGTVTFTTAHGGAGKAVHGGHITLLFDELLGSVALQAAPSRTASLTVNFRGLTPVCTELAVEGWVERVEGRKIVVGGRLREGERVCADATALFIAVDTWG